MISEDIRIWLLALEICSDFIFGKTLITLMRRLRFRSSGGDGICP